MIRPEHVALALGVTLLFPLQGAFSRHPGVEADVLVTLPPERILPALRAGHGGTLADLLEVRAVNYVFARLRPGVLLDRDVPVRLYGAITTLDPDDPGTVQRGSVMLSALADRPQAALALLERGIERVPLDHHGRWRLYWEVMAIHLTALLEADATGRAERLRLAGEALQAMAGQPSCPDPPRFQSAGEALIQNGLIQGLIYEVEVWRERAEQGEGGLRERARERLREAEAMLLRERLQRRVDALLRRTGRAPASLEELPGLDQRGPLEPDPFGTGLFLRQGRVIAPEAERRALQRRLQAARDDWRARGGVGTPSLADLGAAGTVPPWLRVELGEEAVRVDADLELLRHGGR